MGRLSNGRSTHTHTHIFFYVSGLESKANPRRQRRMSPVKSISRGGRGGGGGGRGDTGKGGDTRVSGYFAGGAMSRSNATWQSPNKTEGKVSR